MTDDSVQNEKPFGVDNINLSHVPTELREKNQGNAKNARENLGRSPEHA